MDNRLFAKSLEEVLTSASKHDANVTHSQDDRHGLPGRSEKRLASTGELVDNISSSHERPSKSIRIYSGVASTQKSTSALPVPKTSFKADQEASNSAFEELLPYVYRMDSPAVPSSHFGMTKVSTSKSATLKPSDTTMDLDMQIFNVSPLQTGKMGLSTTMACAHSQEHVMAERRRREKLNQQFAALSAILPGLKKLDKGSILNDTIQYVKHLQERVKTLEEQAPKKMSLAVAKFEPSDSGKEVGAGGSTSEIQVRVVDLDVVVSLHCCKEKGIMVKCLNVLEEMELSITNASILSFSETMLHLTFQGKLGEAGCKLGAEDIVNSVRALFN